MNNKIKEILGLAIGQASMLWSETPKGIFESSRALEICNDTYEQIMKEIAETNPQRDSAIITRTEFRALWAEYQRQWSRPNPPITFGEYAEQALFGATK